MIHHTLLSKSKNREHLKNFRNVDCVLANSQQSLGHASKLQNHKLIPIAVCILVFLLLINLSGVHSFVSFTVSERVFLYTRIYIQGSMHFNMKCDYGYLFSYDQP